MNATARYISLSICTLFCAGCGGGDGGNVPTLISPVVALASPGGIWTGLDSDGGPVRLVVTEAGRFHFVDKFQNQGSGVLTVSNRNELFGDFELVTVLGFGFPDGSIRADCSLSGDLAERRSLTVIVDCTTTAGLQEQITAGLDYDAVYDRDSAIATIAGNYDAGFGLVTTIAGDGTIFQQDPVFGCVINGVVDVIDSAFNVYDFQFGYSNCIGQFGVLNRTSYSGFGTLDNTVVPDFLTITAIGEVAGSPVSVIFVEQRL